MGGPDRRRAEHDHRHPRGRAIGVQRRLQCAHHPPESGADCNVHAVLLGLDGVMRQRRGDGKDGQRKDGAARREECARQPPEEEECDDRRNDGQGPERILARAEPLDNESLTEHEAGWRDLTIGERSDGPREVRSNDAERKVGLIEPERPIGGVLTESEDNAHNKQQGYHHALAARGERQSHWRRPRRRDSRRAATTLYILATPYPTTYPTKTA